MVANTQLLFPIYHSFECVLDHSELALSCKVVRKDAYDDYIRQPRLVFDIVELQEIDFSQDFHCPSASLHLLHVSVTSL